MKTKNGIKNVSKGVIASMAALAFFITASNVACACWYVMGQDELPEEAKKLRKF